MAKKKMIYGNRDLTGDADFDPKNAKERITIWLDETIVDGFRARAKREGVKYQTLINQALHDALRKPSLVKRVELLEKKLGVAGR